MPSRAPQPVYIVPPPPDPLWIRAAKRFWYVPFVGVLLIAIAISGQPAPGLAASSATPGTAVPGQTVMPGQTTIARSTASPDPVPPAVQRARDAFQVLLDAKTNACASFNGDAFQTCSSEFDALAKKGDAMNACLDRAATLGDVDGCAKAAGVHP